MIRDMPSPKKQLKVFRRFTFIAFMRRCCLYDLSWWDIDPRGDRFLVGKIRLKDGRIGVIRFKWRSAKKHVPMSKTGARKSPVLKEYGNVSFAAELEAPEYDALKALYRHFLREDDPVAWLEDTDALRSSGDLQKYAPSRCYASTTDVETRKATLTRLLETRPTSLSEFVNHAD